MLKGNWKTKQQVLLETLEASPLEFHLTGSRFFGKNGIAADYDFFCEISEEIKQFLRDLDFIQLRENIYNDNKSDINTAIVFRKEQIDIQLVKSVQLKIELQDKLLVEKNFPPTRKSWQRAFWDAEYSKFLLAKASF